MDFKTLCCVCLIIRGCVFVTDAKLHTGDGISPSTNTDLAEDKDDGLLLFATLDGALTAIEQDSGHIRWKIKDKPAVKVPRDTSDAIMPIFLPDPRDGSLYLLGNNENPLKKLPFTIPQLVSSSPCRSSDGILYTGKKTDTWYRLDPITGNKQQVLGWDAPSTTCPVESTNSIYIGRTMYSIMMRDSHRPDRKWNVTYYDYTASVMTKEEINSYEYIHFTSSSSGRLITMDRRNGILVWDQDLGSPVIAAYLLADEGLLAVPFTSMANYTISFLVGEYLNRQDSQKDFANQLKFFPTLYVGEHLHGLYALPSMVDQNVVTISASDTGPLLLGGPYTPDSPRPYPLPGHNYPFPSDLYNGGPVDFKNLPDLNSIVFTGHYNVPTYTNNQRLMVAGRDYKDLKLLTDESSGSNNNESPLENINPNDGNKMVTNTVGVQTEDLIRKEAQDGKVINTTSNNGDKGYVSEALVWAKRQDNKGLLLTIVILIFCIFGMAIYLLRQVRQIQSLSQNGSQSNSFNNFLKRSGQITAVSEDLPNGLVRVGKILFNPEELLGKGCEGTFVFKGEFDGRQVAVKRLLPESFTFADREVALLRESDAHPNVIRYYCMEQDRMFRYIALELCQATLSDYVQGKCDISTLQPLDMLKQATSGLAHLHSLDIVHRDIKPHNVLISIPNNRGEVKVMISDFGLCKKLPLGKASFSRRSGITGTDGWIAPEMYEAESRQTSAIDLFSLGCLYYYVLSKGSHPFGSALSRQSNIQENLYNLSELKDEAWLTNVQIPLLKSLISQNPEERTPCSAILKHPMFWDAAKILSFFQDVSDRVEKSESDDHVLKCLETGSYWVVKSDWRLFIHNEVARDLRKYRTYKGESVRDLLRALRNKKHHFRELTKEAQESLGESPEEFVHYWTSRFPLLLAHTWLAMQCVAGEIIFRPYYHETHRFSTAQFQTQVIEFINLNPVVIPGAAGQPNETKEDRYSNNGSFRKSPKRSMAGPGGNNRSPRNNVRHRIGVESKVGQEEGVGLYRNINAGTGKYPKDGQSVDLDEITVGLVESKNVGGLLMLKKRKKRASKADEPVTWAIADNQ